MITVVKIGGNVVDNPQALSQFLKDFSAIAGKKILVHGGGKEATRISQALGLQTTMIDGRRVTDRGTIDVVTMVYAGLINKRIVSALQAIGVNAIGLTGADANAITATRRSPVPVDYGYVGDIDPAQVNVGLLADFLNADLTPVFCAITHDGEGDLLNCNADGVASAIAVAMADECPTRLIYCFEKPGVLADIDDPESCIPLITQQSYAQLREDGSISGGMIPKVENALQAVRRGVDSVIIKSAEHLLDVCGTTITQAND